MKKTDELKDKIESRSVAHDNAVSVAIMSAKNLALIAEVLIDIRDILLEKNI